MKKLTTLTLAAILGLTAAAQTEGYNQIGVSYSLTTYNYDYKGKDEPDPINGNGFSIKYIHGFSVHKSLPMFVETGVNLQFGFGTNDTDEDGYLEQKSQFGNIAIPVNFAYKFKVGEEIYIKPFIGLNFKVNLLGRYKTEHTDDFYSDFEEDHNGMSYDEFVSNYEERTGEEYDDGTGEWTNLFSTSDRKGMGDKDHTWNRVQLGWHIGADFQFNKFFIGLNYGTDFIPAWKLKKNKVSTQTFNIGIGLCF